MALIRGKLEGTMIFFGFMTNRIRSQILDSWKLCHNILWLTNELFQKKEGIFWWNLYEVHYPQSWRVTLGYFGTFTLWLGVSNMCINFFSFFPNPFGQVMHSRHFVLREKRKKPHANCASYSTWRTLAPRSRQLTGSPPKTSNSKPTKKILHAWSMRLLNVGLTHMVVDTITPHQ